MQETAKASSKLPIIILIVGIIILVIMNRGLSSRLDNLHNAVHSVNSMHWSESQSTRMTIWELNNRIDELSEMLIQSTRLSFNESIHIQGFDVQTASADVMISFFLREHTIGSAVSVTAACQNGQTHSYVADFSNGRFTANMILPVHGNYTLTFAQQGQVLTTGELMQLDLSDRLCGRFSFWVNTGQSWGSVGPDVYSLHPRFLNNTQGNDLLEVNHLTLYLEADNEVVRSWDLLPHLMYSGGYTQTFNPGAGREWFFHEAAGFRDIYSIPLELDISFAVGNEPDDVRPGAAVLRLVIYDNLGIRYEQVDPINLWARQDVAGGGWGRTTQAVPVPVPDFNWHSGEWGRVRMVVR